MSVPSASAPDPLSSARPSSPSAPASAPPQSPSDDAQASPADAAPHTAPVHPAHSPDPPAAQPTPLPAPVGGDPPAPSQSPPVQETREALSQTDKDGDRPAPSSSPSAPSPAPSRSSAKKTSSPKANGNGNSALESSPSRTHKPSFLVRLLRALVPCVSPSNNTHTIEINPAVSPSASKEKQPLTAFEHVVPASAQSTTELAKDSTPLDPPVTIESPTLTPADPASPPPQDPSHEAEVPIQPTPPSPPHILPLDETEGVTSGAVQAPGSTGGPPKPENKRHSGDSTPPSNASGEDDSEGTSFTEEEDIDGLDEMEDDEDRLIMNGGAGIPIGPDGRPNPLLPPIAPHQAGRKCLILDLDETLVHSSFKSIQQADYVVPVEIEYHLHNVYVIKRPGVDKFLKKMGEIYEIVVFTASLSKYADPVLDKLDIHQVVSHRLFRESCYNHRGNYVKDLSQLGRPIADTIILDNSPASYIFHPNNAVPVSSWFNDPHDTELTDLIPFLTDLATVEDVRGVLDGAR
ncbi:hypothetical protein C0993_004748 [Termitomyces sp. T159_Od127]|nr:hypothetical protein C0993_004748 [Termitomyces sp. T159_Od127]